MAIGKKLLIRAGRIIDPNAGVDAIGDLLIADGKIEAIGSLGGIQDGVEIIDAQGLWVAPGLIDLHVHLRDPGFQYKEDIISGGKSAAAGGFTTICAMPNTKPVTDNEETVRYILEKGASAPVHILPIGSVTIGQQGLALSPIAALKEAGVCALSEDGYTVLNPRLFKEALAICAETGLPMLSHCEETGLVNGGVVNEGIASKALGLPGISNDSEEVIVSRDMILSEHTGAKLHLCHISTRGSIRLIQDAKARGVQVTAESCPHHFMLCDEDIPANDANFKMNPPLRSRQDMEAVRQGLKDGHIDIIATDHAPHHLDEKNSGFEAGANGIVGLETALPLAITGLVKTGILTPLELIKKMALNPAKVLGIDKGTLSPGAAADITIIDPNAATVIDPATFYSKGKNTPFGGRKVFGRPLFTIVDGAIVYSYNNK